MLIVKQASKVYLFIDEGKLESSEKETYLFSKFSIDLNTSITAKYEYECTMKNQIRFL